MEKKYKYIHMEKIAQKPRTAVYEVVSNSGGGTLGTIEWYGPWRQYCFFPAENTLYSTGCLLDIVDFIKGLKN